MRYVASLPLLLAVWVLAFVATVVSFCFVFPLVSLVDGEVPPMLRMAMDLTRLVYG